MMYLLSLVSSYESRELVRSRKEKPSRAIYDIYEDGRLERIRGKRKYDKIDSRHGNG